MIPLLILLGGAVGACARFVVDGWVRRVVADRFPLGTMVVNVAGSFLLGVIAKVVAEGGPEWLLPLVGTGLCGAFTTFSTFGYDSVMLIERRAWVGAAMNIGGSLILGGLALAAGWAMA